MVQLVTFWGCRLATSLIWVNCGRQLLAGYAGGVMPSTVCLVFMACSCWLGLVIMVGVAMARSCLVVGRGLRGASL
jgi:hypothetical protein